MINNQTNDVIVSGDYPEYDALDLWNRIQDKFLETGNSAKFLWLD